MCAGALYWSKVKRIVWGTDDEKNGHQRITKDESPFHQKAEVNKGVLKEDCARLMKDFFASKR